MDYIKNIIEKIRDYLFYERYFYSECYCPTCKNEILNDKLSQIYEGGTFTNIICSRCGTQSRWDLDCPVPLFISMLK